MAESEYDMGDEPHNESGKQIAKTISITQLFCKFLDEKTCYAWLDSRARA